MKNNSSSLKKSSILASAHNSVAMIFGNQRQYEKALEYFMKAIEIATEIFGTDHYKTKIYKDNLQELSNKMP